MKLSTGWIALLVYLLSFSIIAGAFLVADWTDSDASSLEVCTRSHTVRVPVWQDGKKILVEQERCETYRIQNCDLWKTEKHYGFAKKICENYH